MSWKVCKFVVSAGQAHVPYRMETSAESSRPENEPPKIFIPVKSFTFTLNNPELLLTLPGTIWNHLESKNDASDQRRNQIFFVPFLFCLPYSLNGFTMATFHSHTKAIGIIILGQSSFSHWKVGQTIQVLLKDKKKQFCTPHRFARCLCPPPVCQSTRRHTLLNVSALLNFKWFLASHTWLSPIYTSQSSGGGRLFFCSATKLWSTMGLKAIATSHPRLHPPILVCPPCRCLVL